MAANKIRVYQLAKQVGLSNNQVIDFLQKEGIKVKSHASTVDQETANLIVERIKKKSDDTDTTEPEDTDGVPESLIDEELTVIDELEEELEEELVSKKSKRSKRIKPDEELDSGKKEKKKGKQEPSSFKPHPQARHKPENVSGKPTPLAIENKQIQMRPPIVVKDLAEAMGLKPNVLIMELLEENVMASINQAIDTEKAIAICKKHGYELLAEKRVRGAKLTDEIEIIEPENVVYGNAAVEPRPPIVAFLGHVDHGKTSLQDKIRNTNVVDGEAGKITQHIGASSIEYNGHKITFVDTPGHEAFTAMRARGANVTDIVILVVAADDGFMPQTIEALNHARAAEVQIIVAINKMDLPAANPETVLRQMMEQSIMPEEWGGDTAAIRVSAETGDGLDELLDRILLESEMMEFRANSELPGQAVVVESNLEEGLGATGNLIVQNGTIKIGDLVICGHFYGKIKALIDDKGNRVKSAGPSMPVKLVGLNGVPMCGDKLVVCKDERQAKRLSSERDAQKRQSDLAPPVVNDLDSLFLQMAERKKLDIKVIVKSDVQGTCEAICQSLLKIESDKIRMTILHAGVGSITENDVLLASASSAVIVGFHVRVNPGVNAAAKREGVEIRLYSIIYELLATIRELMEGKLGPEFKEESLGKARILKIFELSQGDKICGSTVTQGVIRNQAKARVYRGNELIYNGDIVSLRHFQDDSKEVRAGQECGIRLDNFRDFEEGDIVDCYDYIQVKATL